MRCIIETVERASKYQFGEPKEIIVDKVPWEKEGHQGYTYSYHMSNERFERNNQKQYIISLEEESGENGGEGKRVRLSTMGYYDFIDFSYEDCISDRVVENTAKQLNTTVEEVEQVAGKELKKLQSVIREEFSRTEEAIARQEHEAIINKHNKARRDFSMQCGFPPVAYDRCYNVFGQLMDAEYLGHLNAILERREQMKKESKRYRKSESQKRFHEYLHTSTSVNFSNEEQMILSKFYKVLAKKYHPDANPGCDTSEEMTLLNKVKKEWGV